MTRPAGQSGSMVVALQSEFDVIDLPLTEIVPPHDGGTSLAAKLAHLDDYAWVIVTSTNGARSLLDALSDVGGALPGAGSAPRFGAIGERTAATLAEAGVTVDFIPSKFEPQTFVREFPAAQSPAADRVLLARAEAASAVLPTGLETKGWVVDDVVAYRSTPTVPDPDLLAAAIGADVVTFTAPSAVELFRQLLGDRRCGAAIASIGPVTSEAARHHGFDVSIEPEQHSVADLVAAIDDWAATTP